MIDTKVIIRVLGFIQEYFDNHADEQEPDCRKEMFRDWSEITLDAITLLKAQEAETVDAPKPDSDIGCWYDITHNYTLEQVVSALKAQELCEDAEKDDYMSLFQEDEENLDIKPNTDDE